MMRSLKSGELGDKVSVADRIVLEIPAKAEYVALCRLAVSGLGAGTGLDGDQIADLKVAVSEGCSYFLTEGDGSDAGAYDLPGESEDPQSLPTLQIDFSLAADRWTVDISGPDAEGRSGSSAGGGTPGEPDLGWMVIEALVDEAQREPLSAEKGRLRLIRYLA